MKKVISILLTLAMVITLFAGCSSPADSGRNDPDVPDVPNNPIVNNSEPVDPATAVRLLLASERLNAALLKNEGDIFENGVEVMQKLSSMTAASVIRLGEQQPGYLSSTVSLPRPGITSDDVVSLSADTVFDNTYGGGVVTFDGEKYMFSEFVEVSNSYSAFYSTAKGITTMADNAAALIDNIKKNVRVVDKWVRVSPIEQYYLHVGENEEILYEKFDTRTSVCRRYRNEDGNNVYEYYMQERDSYYRMVYIPGVHFEAINGILGQQYDSHYMIADNTKGYWESYCVGPFPTHYNVSYMVMKDDVCYDSFYNPKTGQINFLKIISADKKTDLFNYEGSEEEDVICISVHLSGHDGYVGVEVDPSAVSNVDMGGEIGSIPYFTGSDDQCRLVMKDGSTIKVGDTFVNGQVEVRALRLSFYYPDYTSEIAIFMRADTVEEYLALYKAFLEETGLTCRRDIDTVLPGVRRAFAELKEITKYHTWNGYAQATEEGIAAAIRAEDAYTIIFGEMIESIRDAEVIDFTNKEAMELNAHFAPVTVSGLSNITQTGMSVNIGAITLSVSDTLLFVENEPYTVGFALSGDSGLVHLDAGENIKTTPYTDGSSFMVSVSDITLDLPHLLDGSYTLVTYITTADGIRSSAYSAFKFDSVDTEAAVTLTRSTMSSDTNAKGELVITYELITDIYVLFTGEGPITYNELYEMMATGVCEYGIPSGAQVEILTDDNAYVAMSGEEIDITGGSYRLAYDIQNGDKIVNGYIYAEYTVPVVEA